MVWIDSVVTRKPRDVWRVSAVPMLWAGTTRVTSVENCALSAITVTLQTSRRTMSGTIGPPKAAALASAHAPLVAIAMVTSRA